MFNNAVLTAFNFYFITFFIAILLKILVFLIKKQILEF